MKLDDVDGDDFQIEDRRGQGSSGGGLGGLGSVLGGGGKGAKIGIPALIVVVIGIFLSQAGGGGGSGGGSGSGDLDEAIDAAQAVGDDAISGSNANQESFTHGTSAQRKQWFTTGFESGDASACDTFG